MQSRPTRSPWYLMTKALLGTPELLRDAHAARPICGWRQFGVEVAEQIRRYLEEFYDATGDDATDDEIAPLVAEFRALLAGDSATLLAWVTRHLPDVLEGAEPKHKKEFVLGLREGAGV